ncbi:hypothetical protein HK097_001912, partial [Rhizophlyctis rosea]
MKKPRSKTKKPKNDSPAVPAATTDIPCETPDPTDPTPSTPAAKPQPEKKKYVHGKPGRTAPNVQWKPSGTVTALENVMPTPSLTPTPAFGGAPAFGSSVPVFGSPAPSFGGTPAFGTPAFGSQPSPSSNTAAPSSSLGELADLLSKRDKKYAWGQEEFEAESTQKQNGVNGDSKKKNRNET